MPGILRYNMHFNYYRVFSPSLSFSTRVLFCRELLMYLRVNKWSSHLKPSVFCLCLCFEFNPTPSRSGIPNATLVSHVFSLPICSSFWLPFFFMATHVPWKFAAHIRYHCFALHTCSLLLSYIPGCLSCVDYIRFEVQPEAPCLPLSRLSPWWPISYEYLGSWLVQDFAAYWRMHSMILSNFCDMPATFFLKITTSGPCNQHHMLQWKYHQHILGSSLRISDILCLRFFPTGATLNGNLVCLNPPN